VHRQTGRFVALKNLENRRFPTHQFLRELRFLLSLQHPNIVTCQALEHTSTGRCLVMDYCEGGTLRNLMDETVRLNLPQSLKLVADILAGLEHAHNRGIVHCDIKPENILLNLQPHGWTARISDFGIARLSQELSDVGLGNTGSPAYMAPERFYGQYSLTSDLYSVGILLFELLAGYRPFAGTPSELMSAHLNHPVRLPDTIPAIWHPFLLKSLQKLSARRFRSAGEMLTMLKTIAATEGSGSWLDSSSLQLPLLKSLVPLSIHPFASQQVEKLSEPIVHLAIASSSASKALQSETSEAPAFIYRAENQQISFQGSKLQCERSSVLIAPQLNDRHTAFSEPIQELFARPQGCFVLLPHSLQLRLALPHLGQAAVRSILQFNCPFSVAVEAQGRWLAAATCQAETNSRMLSVWRFSSSNPTQFNFSPRSVQCAAPPKPAQLFKLLALDAYHIAVFSRLVAKDNQFASGQMSAQSRNFSGTLIEVFTRRGDRIHTLTLPFVLEQVILTQAPYQLAAIDAADNHSVLLIDLKPFRVLRRGLEIKPQFLSAAPWGYVVANKLGQIILLDQTGYPVAQIDAPEEITAIAPTSSHDLLVATWKGQQGSLNQLDLQDLGVPILF
jgi:serine/threonine protein kinase